MCFPEKVDNEVPTGYICQHRFGIGEDWSEFYEVVINPNYYGICGTMDGKN